MPEAHAQDPKPTGSLNIGLSGLSSNATDPILFGYAIKFYLALVFDYLIGTDASGNLSKETGLARDWKISPDKKTFTITLRDGAKFQNGDPVTSADVKFTITRALGPKSRTGYADYLRDNLDQIETPTPTQVVITTKNPAPFLLSSLSRAMSTGTPLEKMRSGTRGSRASPSSGWATSCDSTESPRATPWISNR